MPFANINPALEQALAARGYTEPTPVQAAAGAGAPLDEALLLFFGGERDPATLRLLGS